MSFESELRLSATVLRGAFTPDGMGGGTVSTSETSIRAALWQTSGAEAFAAGKHQKVGSHTLACLPSVDVQENDRISVSGAMYRVISRPDDVMGHGEVMTVNLERLEA